MMKQLSLPLFLLLPSLCCLHGEETPPHLLIERSLEQIEKQQQSLQAEISHLRSLLALKSTLLEVKLLSIADATQEVQKITKEASAAYEEKKYDKAKELFYQAWELAPEHGGIQHNLALAYYHLGNIPLAKKMFQSALKATPSLPQAAVIQEFLTGKEEKSTRSTSMEEPADIKALRTELLNKQKEIQSYSNSSLSLAQKLQKIIKLLDELRMQVEGHDALVRDHFLWLSETYATFDYYKQAFEVLQTYEKAMEGKELPDGYHSKKLQLQQQSQEQQQRLELYLQDQPDASIARQLESDRQELAIFAAQMEEFVSTADANDSDFGNLCQRLKEFKWGKKRARHVLVIDRYQNILFSSLTGTLALERYQDAQGRKFFRDITLLHDKLPFKQVGSLAVDLQINGHVVPYVLLYTYVPKHQVFLIVRLLKEDLLSP